MARKTCCWGRRVKRSSWSFIPLRLTGRPPARSDPVQLNPWRLWQTSWNPARAGQDAGIVAQPVRSRPTCQEQGFSVGI